MKMFFSEALRQRILVCIMMMGLVAITHLAYARLRPQWLLYHEAQQYYREKEWDKAVALYEQSLAAGLDDPTAMERVGDSYSHLQNFPKAIEWYRRSLTLRPDNNWVRKSLAEALKANGNLEEAAKEYERMLHYKDRSGDIIPR